VEEVKWVCVIVGGVVLAGGDAVGGFWLEKTAVLEDRAKIGVGRCKLNGVIDLVWTFSLAFFLISQTSLRHIALTPSRP
jgi:hypothetical protein